MAILLRRTADLPDLTGVFERRLGDEEPYRRFRYEVVRVWQRPVTTFLQGPLGILPLAPLGDVREADLPAVIQEMDTRIQREARPGESGTLWTATGILMGLRYSDALISDLLRGVHAMKDSTFYQHIVAEGVVIGRLDEARRVLLRQGRERFGAPSEAAQATVNALTDLERIEELHIRLLHVGSWEELLTAP